MDLVLGFQQHFLLAVLTAADSFVDQTGCFHLCRTDFTLRNLLTVHHTDEETDGNTDQNANDGKNNITHNLAAHLLLENSRLKGWAQ